MNNNASNGRYLSHTSFDGSSSSSCHKIEPVILNEPVPSQPIRNGQLSYNAPTVSDSGKVAPTFLFKEPSKTKIPDLPIEFPELEKLSNSQLERLLADPMAIKVG